MQANAPPPYAWGFYYPVGAALVARTFGRGFSRRRSSLQGMYFSALVGRKVPKERHPRQGTHGAFLGNPTTSSARPFAPAKGLIARTGRGLTVARGIGGAPITSVVTYSTRGWVVARRGALAELVRREQAPALRLGVLLPRRGDHCVNRHIVYKL